MFKWWNGPRGGKGMFPLERRAKWVSSIMSGLPDVQQVGSGGRKVNQTEWPRVSQVLKLPSMKYNWKKRMKRKGKKAKERIVRPIRPSTPVIPTASMTKTSITTSLSRKLEINEIPCIRKVRQTKKEQRQQSSNVLSEVAVGSFDQQHVKCSKKIINVQHSTGLIPTMEVNCAVIEVKEQHLLEQYRREGAPPLAAVGVIVRDNMEKDDDINASQEKSIVGEDVGGEEDSDGIHSREEDEDGYDDSSDGPLLGDMTARQGTSDADNLANSGAAVPGGVAASYLFLTGRSGLVVPAGSDRFNKINARYVGGVPDDTSAIQSLLGHKPGRDCIQLNGGMIEGDSLHDCMTVYTTYKTELLDVIKKFGEKEFEVSRGKEMKLLEEEGFKKRELKVATIPDPESGVFSAGSADEMDFYKNAAADTIASSSDSITVTPHSLSVVSSFPTMTSQEVISTTQSQLTFLSAGGLLSSMQDLITPTSLSSVLQLLPQPLSYQISSAGTRASSDETSLLNLDLHPLSSHDDLEAQPTEVLNTQDVSMAGTSCTNSGRESNLCATSRCVDPFFLAALPKDKKEKTENVRSKHHNCMFSSQVDGDPGDDSDESDKSDTFSFTMAHESSGSDFSFTIANSDDDADGTDEQELPTMSFELPAIIYPKLPSPAPGPLPEFVSKSKCSTTCHANCSDALLSWSREDFEIVRSCFSGIKSVTLKNKLLLHLQFQEKAGLRVSGFFFNKQLLCVNYFCQITSISRYYVTTVLQDFSTGCLRYVHAGENYIKCSPARTTFVCWMIVFSQSFGQNGPTDVVTVLPSYLNKAELYKIYTNEAPKPHVKLSTFYKLMKSTFGPRRDDKGRHRIIFFLNINNACILIW